MATSYPLAVVPFGIVPFYTYVSDVVASHAWRRSLLHSRFRVVVTTCFILSYLPPCLVVEGSGQCCPIVGSTAGTMVAYAIPSYAYVRTF